MLLRLSWKRLALPSSSSNFTELYAFKSPLLPLRAVGAGDFLVLCLRAQWRVVFRWTGKGAVDVDFIDYHK